ncbi:MAG: cytochrome c oxidase assembly protein [Alphaproteobacteria bacterium]|nr:cytochrome c oxidase assembly protein [Alphaproteobacteria bacterium]
MLLLASARAADAGKAGLDRAVEWSWDWWVLASLALTAFWYGSGVVRLHRRLGAARIVDGFESATYACGLGTIFFALQSPIDSISDQLFCVHMVQHLLLMLVAAPLLVLGRPAIAFLWAFQPRGRKWVGRIWTGLALHSFVRAIMIRLRSGCCSTLFLSLGIFRDRTRRPWIAKEFIRLSI